MTWKLTAGPVCARQITVVVPAGKNDLMPDCNVLADDFPAFTCRRLTTVAGTGRRRISHDSSGLSRIGVHSNVGRGGELAHIRIDRNF